MKVRWCGAMYVGNIILTDDITLLDTKTGLSILMGGGGMESTAFSG